MKKLVLFFLSLVLLLPSAYAEEAPETVSQMTYVLKMPDVIREGLYTGEIKDGLPNGFGVFVTENSEGDQWHYIGAWENGAMCGDGGTYWESGQANVGTYADNTMVSGYYHASPTTNIYIDYSPNDHGCNTVKLYRTDDSLYFDGCVNPDTGNLHQGTIYTKDGKVFFSGELGDGFNWDYIYNIQ